MLYNIHIAILLCLIFLCLIYPLSPHPAAMAKKKKNRPQQSAAVSTSGTAGAELSSAIKAVQWLASGQGKSDGGVEWLDCGGECSVYYITLYYIILMLYYITLDLLYVIIVLYHIALYYVIIFFKFYIILFLYYIKCCFIILGCYYYNILYCIIFYLCYISIYYHILYFICFKYIMLY